MKKFVTIVMSVLTTTLFGQAFEGKIVYQTSYQSKIPSVTDQQFTVMMGSKQEYLIKGGNYKSNANGTMFIWQLYINKDNKLYNKMSNSGTVFWNDGSTNPDEVLNAKVNKNVTEILGYTCDELVLTCKSGIQKYYYNSKLGVDITLYSKHIFGNWV